MKLFNFAMHTIKCALYLQQLQIALKWEIPTIRLALIYE